MNALQLFFLWWAAKEAFVKWDGRGLGLDMSRVEVRMDSDVLDAFLLDRPRVFDPMHSFDVDRQTFAMQVSCDGSEMDALVDVRSFWMDGEHVVALCRNRRMHASAKCAVQGHSPIEWQRMLDEEGFYT